MLISENKYEEAISLINNYLGQDLTEECLNKLNTLMSKVDDSKSLYEEKSKRIAEEEKRLEEERKAEEERKKQEQFANNEVVNKKEESNTIIGVFKFKKYKCPSYFSFTNKSSFKIMWSISRMIPFNYF